MTGVDLVPECQKKWQIKEPSNSSSVSGTYGKKRYTDQLSNELQTNMIPRDRAFVVNLTVSSIEQDVCK